MVSTVEKTGHQPTTGQDKKKDRKRYPAAFSKYKFYLDIKTSKAKSSLIDDIQALGGVSF